jgi:hypothetical protein
MYSFAQRSDTEVCDEPFYGHYLRVTGIDHPGREETLAQMESDGRKVIQEVIFGEGKKPLRFYKQMAHHLIELDENWLLDTQNLFLIRHPAEVITSFAKVIERPVMRDIGFARQAEIFDFLLAHGQRPLVIDGNELLKNPRLILSQACKQLGIPFEPAMLQWTAGPRPEDGCWAKYWYHRVHASTGFAPYEPRSRAVPPHLTGLLAEALPLYERLWAYALRAEA